MKYVAIAFLLLITALQSAGRNGYYVRLKMTDVQDTMVYLTHYYGLGRPKIFITDSAVLDKNGIAVFENKEAGFVGGIYMLLLKDNAQSNFEFVLNNGDDISITASKSRLPDGIRFTNSPENERFQKYIAFTQNFAEKQKDLESRLKKAKTIADTDDVRKDARTASQARIRYMHDYANSYPGTLLAEVFLAMETPAVPEGPHFLEDGTTKDSAYAYRYYKTHYWDNFNFRDDRLIYTPLYDGKLDEYFSKLVLPWPDSVEKECDVLLGKAKGTKDMFHYSLWWLTRYAEDSKIMGMDEVFVYLVENYYMKGDAFWLSSDELQKYFNRAIAIAPNIIGNIAPEVRTQNIYTKKEEVLSAVKADYTLVVFYSPTCGHCQHEIPLIDSVYEAVLKRKGVKVFTVATEGDEKSITDFLEKQQVGMKWVNTWDPQHMSDYRNKYDVYSTPTIYLLDDKKIIRGKRLDHSNIAALIDNRERKQRTTVTAKPGEK